MCSVRRHYHVNNTALLNFVYSICVKVLIFLAYLLNTFLIQIYVYKPCTLLNTLFNVAIF